MKDNKFNYQMIDKFRSDIDYFLGWGGRVLSRFVDSPKYYFDELDKYYELVEEKPEWLTREQIELYRYIVFKTDYTFFDVTRKGKDKLVLSKPVQDEKGKYTKELIIHVDKSPVSAKERDFEDEDVIIRTFITTQPDPLELW